MTAAVETLKFKPASTTVGRRLDDWAADLYLNVLNFGVSVGTGSDDTTAFQTCFDTAFGGPLDTAGASSPHGITNAHLNRPVFIPNGTYLVRNLTLNQLYGARIIGCGLQTTRLIFTGSTSGSNAVIWVDGAENCLFEDFSTNGPTGGGASGINLTGFDLNWTGSGSVGLKNNRFNGTSYGDCLIGLCVARSGLEGSGNIFTSVNLGSDKYGIKIAGAAAVGNTVIGGGQIECAGNLTTDNSAAFYVAAGSISTFIDLCPAGQQTDIIWESPETCIVIGTRSESWNFLKITDGTAILLGVNHDGIPDGITHWTTGGRTYAPTGGTHGVFATIGPDATVVFDGCQGNNATILSSPNPGGTVYHRGGSQFLNVVAVRDDSKTWLTDFHGAFREFMTSVVSFANRPIGADGCEVAIDDCSAATIASGWGATVTGGGTAHALMRWNGTNWTLVGK